VIADRSREGGGAPALPQLAGPVPQSYEGLLAGRRGDDAPTGRVDVPRACRAVEELLLALGQDVHRDGLRRTPERVARAFEEMLSPLPFDVTTVPNAEGYDELVLVRDVPFSSLCEHHLLPFQGVAHVAYLPGRRVAGQAELARVVDRCSRRLQVQERMAMQIADWLTDELAPRGAGVVLTAEHLWMRVREARAAGSTTTTSALRGRLRDDPRSRAELLSLVRRSGS
jgi:GTP cyclohydrolase I